MLIAQAAAEYGAGSVVVSVVQSLLYRLEYALQSDGATTFLVIGAALLVWWLFFRSR